MSNKTGFAVLFSTFTLLAFASSAPSPLYVVWQREWDFSAITLTSVFAVYAIALLAALALLVPESVVRDGQWRGSLVPQIGVPADVRAAFVRSLPCLAATWALGGLVLSIGPSLTVGVLGAATHLSGALPIFVMAGI